MGEFSSTGKTGLPGVSGITLFPFIIYPMPEEAGIPETNPSICPFCNKTESAHLMVKLNSNTRSVSSGILLKGAEKKLEELREIGMDYRQAFLELKERLFRVWGKVDDRRVTNVGKIEYWFWAQQEYHVRRQFAQYEMPQTCSRGDFIVAPVDGNAFNVARPDRDAGVISEKEQEAGRLARLEQEAIGRDYPLWALKFYSSGTLRAFCDYALGKGCEPKLRGSGINADFLNHLAASFWSWSTPSP